MERNYCIEAPLTCLTNLNEIFTLTDWLELLYLVITVAPYVALT